jgi:hypothetical protein
MCVISSAQSNLKIANILSFYAGKQFGVYTKNVMKKIVVIAAFMTVLASCGNNGNSNASNADSTNVQLPVTDSSSSGSAITPSTGNSGAATGTTGTGTVADSGNAAHPGSDTSYHTPHK